MNMTSLGTCKVTILEKNKGFKNLLGSFRKLADKILIVVRDGQCFVDFPGINGPGACSEKQAWVG